MKVTIWLPWKTDVMSVPGTRLIRFWVGPLPYDGFPDIFEYEDTYQYYCSQEQQYMVVPKPVTLSAVITLAEKGWEGYFL